MNTACSSILGDTSQEKSDFVCESDHAITDVHPHTTHLPYIYITNVNCNKFKISIFYLKPQVAPDVAQFDTYTNDVWASRHASLWRFQQAARTVIIRTRADKKITGLRQMMLDWGANKYSNTVTGRQGGSRMEFIREMIDRAPFHYICTCVRTSISLPVYIQASPYILYSA